MGVFTLESTTLMIFSLQSVLFAILPQIFLLELVAESRCRKTFWLVKQIVSKQVFLTRN